MRQRVFAALFLAGCTLGSRRDAVPRFNPEDATRKLQQIQAAAQSDPSLLARAGWLRYLIASDPKGAVPKLEAAARDPTIELEAWRSVGAVQRWRVGGPFAALRLFDLRRTLPLDGRVPTAATVNDRTLEFPDGDAGLDLEPADGDIFYAVSEVTLERGGEYLLWAEGAAALEARLDGAVAISRVP